MMIIPRPWQPMWVQKRHSDPSAESRTDNPYFRRCLISRSPSSPLHHQCPVPSGSCHPRTGAANGVPTDSRSLSAQRNNRSRGSKGTGVARLAEAPGESWIRAVCPRPPGGRSGEQHVRLPWHVRHCRSHVTGTRRDETRRDACPGGIRALPALYRIMGGGKISTCARANERSPEPRRTILYAGHRITVTGLPLAIADRAMHDVWGEQRGQGEGTNEE
ncbi:hypothetical protein VTN02DRAFT_5518 [Thermoascus thermophilus]